MSSRLKILRPFQTRPGETADPLGGGDTNELIRLSQILSSRPDDTDVQRQMYDAMRRWLDRNAFLAYVSESRKLYQVRTRSGLYLNVPKDRALVPVYPLPEPSLLHSASRWLAASILGLFLGGALTVLAGPVIISQVAAAWATQHPSRSEKARAITLVLCALLLMIVGTILSALLVVHIIY